MKDVHCIDLSCVCVCARADTMAKKGKNENKNSGEKFRFVVEISIPAVWLALCRWFSWGAFYKRYKHSSKTSLSFLFSVVVVFFSLRSVCLVRNCIGHHVHRYHVMSVLNECSTFRFSYQFALYFVDAKWFVWWQMRGSKIESKKCNCIRYTYWSRLDRLAHVGTIRATCCRTVSSRDVFIN